jgi:hypothetical protein
MKKNLIVTLSIALAMAAGAIAQNQNPAAAAPPADNPPATPATVVPPPPPPDNQPPAETKPKTKKQAPAKTKKPAGYPFRGTIKAVDKADMTFTVAGKEKDRVFAATSQTRFTKDGQPATFADLAADEKISGYAHAGKDGRAEAVSVTLGAPVPKGKEKGTAKKTSSKKATEKPADAPTN